MNETQAKKLIVCLANQPDNQAGSYGNVSEKVNSGNSTRTVSQYGTLTDGQTDRRTNGLMTQSTQNAASHSEPKRARKSTAAAAAVV